MTKDKKRIVFIISIVAVCSLAVAVSVYAIITNASFSKNEEENVSVYDFDSIFNNEITSNVYNKEEVEEIAYLGYDIYETDSIKYDISIKLPKILIETENSNKINEDIYNLFIGKAIEIQDNSTVYTKYDVQYTGYINENLLSIVIKCNLKAGSNPQKKIVTTYMYDIKEDKILNIQDLIENKNLNGEKIQKRIRDSIKELAESDKTITDIGYNVYIREPESEIYDIENITEFYINQDGEIFVIFAYGNTNYTTKTDVIKIM